MLFKKQNLTSNDSKNGGIVSKILDIVADFTLINPLIQINNFSS
jgi:hypothetical protein